MDRHIKFNEDSRSPSSLRTPSRRLKDWRIAETRGMMTAILNRVLLSFKLT